ncbi:ankyrin repeat-containing domain protein [Xylaria digitata]|nr:ankyrin repeat-containing domain protein [Xylaria digitata]
MDAQEQLRRLQQDAQRTAALMSKQATGQNLTAAEVKEQERIDAKNAAALDARRRALETQFAQLHSLPLPLPEYLGVGPSSYSSNEDFSTWCRDGNVDAVTRHIEAQQGNIEDSSLQQGLAWAAEQGKGEVVHYLLQKGAKLHGYAVEWACRRRDLALFKIFVEYGWHPNQQIPSPEGKFGVALPHCTNDFQITKYLLTHGADPNLGSFDRRKHSGLGPTPPMDRRSGAALTAAATSGNIEVTDLLLRHGAKLEWATPLHAALSVPEAWQQNRPAFEHLLHQGADPNKNIRFPFGNVWEMGTPLFWAVRVFNWHAVELLLEWGADPEIGNVLAFAAANEWRQTSWLVKPPPKGGSGNPLGHTDVSSKASTLVEIIERVKQKKGIS